MKEFQDNLFGAWVESGMAAQRNKNGVVHFACPACPGLFEVSSEAILCGHCNWKAEGKPEEIARQAAEKKGIKPRTVTLAEMIENAPMRNEDPARVFEQELYGAWRSVGLVAAPSKLSGGLGFACPACDLGKLMVDVRTVACDACDWRASGEAWEVAAKGKAAVKVEDSGMGGAGHESKRLNVRRLFDLERPKAGDESELLKNRFLCRGGGALLVGATGQGKSSLAMQAALSWAAGLPLFGIAPNGPLRVLLLQGENDDGDLTEARDGVAWELEACWMFDDEEEAEARRRLIADNVLVVSENELVGESLFGALEAILFEHKPDLIIIDPAFSYVEGDAGASRDVGKFLRQGLNPLLGRHRCGCFVVHHTAKPPSQKGAVDRSASAYAGHGSAEWANWARAILTIEGIGSGRFKLHGAKRGGRIGWKDGEGKTAFHKVLEHSHNDGGFAWQEVTGEALENPSKNVGKPGVAELVELVPLSEVVSKSILEVQMRAAGFAEKWGRIVLNAALDEGAVFSHKLPRPGRKAAVGYARYPSAAGGEGEP